MLIIKYIVWNVLNVVIAINQFKIIITPKMASLIVQNVILKI